MGRLREFQLQAFNARRWLPVVSRDVAPDKAAVDRVAVSAQLSAGELLDGSLK